MRKIAAVLAAAALCAGLAGCDLQGAPTAQAGTNYLVILYSGGRPVHWWYSAQDCYAAVYGTLWGAGGEGGGCGPDSFSGTVLEIPVAAVTPRLIAEYRLAGVPKD